MNKYQEALRKIQIGLGFKLNEVEYENAFNTLKELVDKETPTKPLNQEVIDWGLGNAGDCKNCSREVNYQNKYCGNCGQKIDWSDEE